MAHTFWVNDKQLDAEQGMAIQGQKEDASFLLRGPAGSGKTNVLLLRARWLKLKKLSHIRIVVFTSSLKTFMQEGCVQYGIEPECVVTGMQFFRELLVEYGVELERTGNFEDDRDLLAGRVKALIEAKKIPEIYQAILVDESQDYTDTELLIFRQLTKRLVLAADSRQSIYRVTHTAGLPEQLVHENALALKYHYRSGLRLCTVADAILKDNVNFPPMKGECKYDEEARPSSVELHELPNFTSQIEAILQRIPDQLDLYPGEKIGVLFPKREQEAEFAQALASMGLPEDRVWSDTLHGGKGWEFRAVHIGGCEALYKMGPTQKRLIYTGILRGRTAANLYYSGAVPGYLDGAVAQLAPPPADPELSQLFGQNL
ncbi:UvrD-helicase domain-containing protein [Variovorax boronicumulans]|uniref:UvrD-helicase domain-containing protein n=1 Tax=Variovorax boronicumulans TaxID=436515 RepID=UPI00277D657A|nr:UvrD-helicase domain-containing protein [Variovorax boronicumulans]MDQ0042247.1 superfamily I DNA/RNA helicase [Variovorax boronicumulans]